VNTNVARLGFAVSDGVYSGSRPVAPADGATAFPRSIGTFLELASRRHTYLLYEYAFGGPFLSLLGFFSIFILWPTPCVVLFHAVTVFAFSLFDAKKHSERLVAALFVPELSDRPH